MRPPAIHSLAPSIYGGQPSLRRARDDASAGLKEQWAWENEDPADARFAHNREGLTKIIRPPHLCELQLQSERVTCCFGFVQKVTRRAVAKYIRLPEDTYATGRRHHSLEQLQALCDQTARKRAHAGNVPTWPSQASDQSASDGIRDERDDDRNGGRRLLGGLGGRRGRRHNQVDLESD
jgi:hypothetical protein